MWVLVDLALNEPWRFFILDEVLAVSRGDERDTRSARTGWISGRGRDTDCYSLRIVHEKMIRNLKQSISSISLLHLVCDIALIKHFELIQRLLWIIVSKKVTRKNCSSALYKKKYQLKNLKCLKSTNCQAKIQVLSPKSKSKV